MAQYLAGGIDQKIVAASIVNTLKVTEDYSAFFNADFVADVNAQRTNTAVVRIAPSVSLATTTADRDGLLARTAATGSYVEVALTADKYFKVAIDELDVQPEIQAQEIGAAGARAIAAYGNGVLIAAAVADGTDNYLGETFGSGTTGDEVWAALVDCQAAYAENGLTEDNTLFIAPAVWGTLLKDVGVLRVSVDARVQAANLLGVKRVIVAPITDALAVFAHSSGVVLARRLASVNTRQEDVDVTVIGRVKVGAKVLDANAVQVLKDGAGS